MRCQIKDTGLRVIENRLEEFTHEIAVYCKITTERRFGGMKTAAGLAGCTVKTC